MAGVAGGELVSAVSNNGGFGILGGGYGDPAFLDQQLQLINTTNPYGVGFITWRLHDNPRLLNMALEAKPRAVLLSFGDAAPFVKQIKTQNVLFIAQCQSVADALNAANLGADLIVAQGTEAGGHGSTRATMSLLPAVVDAVSDVAIIAAGGIGDGRGLAASLALGAEGVMLGSRFFASTESLAPEPAKRKAVLATGDQTIRTSVFDVLRQYDWPRPYNLRSLKNTMTELFANDIDLLKTNKAQEMTRFSNAVDANDFDIAPVIVGEAIDLIHDLPAAGEIIGRLMNEANEAIQATTRRLQS